MSRLILLKIDCDANYNWVCELDHEGGQEDFASRDTAKFRKKICKRPGEGAHNAASVMYGPSTLAYKTILKHVVPCCLCDGQ